jgi:hypothetical protein
MCFEHVITFRGRFCSVLMGVPLMTHDLSAILGWAFPLHGAVAGTIAMPFLSSMLLLHICMVTFIF